MKQHLLFTVFLSLAFLMFAIAAPVMILQSYANDENVPPSITTDEPDPTITDSGQDENDNTGGENNGEGGAEPIIGEPIVDEPDPIDTEIDISSYSAELSIQSVVYSGKSIEPEVTVLTDEGLVLEDIYYDVTYANNTDIGTATVTITGKEGFTGSLTASFIISPGNATVKKVTPFYKGATVSIKGVSGKVSYQLRYMPSGGKWKSVYIGTANSKAIKKLVNRKYYWFSVRAYKKVNGRTYYGPWCKAKKQQIGIPISKCKITGITNKIYNKKLKTQAVKVTYKGKKATFRVKYGNRKYIGKRYLKITGTGKYIGTVTKYYKILPGRAKITGMCPYEWFYDDDNSYTEEYPDREMRYEYYSSSVGDFFIEECDLRCGVVPGGVSYQFAFYDGSGWDYCSYGKDRTVYWYDFPRNRTLYAKVRAYKVVNGVKYYGKWSPTVSETSKWKQVHSRAYRPNAKYVRGYISNVYKGEYLKIQVGKKTIIKRISKSASKYTFKYKFKKMKPGTKIKITLLSRFKEQITYWDDYCYYAKPKKGMTKKQARWIEGWGAPDEKYYTANSEIWWYDDDGDGYADDSYLYFYHGKLKNWYY